MVRKVETFMGNLFYVIGFSFCGQSWNHNKGKETGRNWENGRWNSGGRLGLHYNWVVWLGIRRGGKPWEISFKDRNLGWKRDLLENGAETVASHQYWRNWWIRRRRRVRGWGIRRWIGGIGACRCYRFQILSRMPLICLICCIIGIICMLMLIFFLSRIKENE